MRIEKYIKDWSRVYVDGIPDEVPNRLEQLKKAPSYKSIVRCFLKGDLDLLELGFQRRKSKAYNDIKKEELTRRGVRVEIELL